MLLKYFYDKSLAHASYMVGANARAKRLLLTLVAVSNNTSTQRLPRVCESRVQRKLISMQTLYRDREN